MGFIKKNWFVILFVTALFAVSIFPQLFKELFVEETGKADIIGYKIGGILSILVLLRWRYTAKIFVLAFIVFCAFDVLILIVTSSKHFVNTLFLFSAHIALLVYFIRSKKMKEYLEVR